MAIQPPVSARCFGESLKKPKTASSSVTKDRTIDKSSKKSKSDSFRSFSKLPAELRLKIWNLSHPGPRLVSIQCGSNISSISDSAKPQASSRAAPNGCTSSTTIPNTLHACAESRREALKHYRPAFGFARGPGHVLFSHDNDIMYFGPRDGYMAAHSQFGTCMALCDPAELARVRRLAINDALFWIDGTYRSMTAASMTTDVLKQIAQRMPGLRELIFVPREEDESSDPALVQDRIMQQIQTAMLTVCEQFPSWSPPPWHIVPLSALP
ncbi:hypothetical protein PT974_10574 [Cladobotryum mycophilum]|uniref:2EXR domain-containing protein n=1 Tax=Cladobotryum mycophilum TaxID=491253 RepID=A0ABR0SBP3_9HYPO